MTTLVICALVLVISLWRVEVGLAVSLHTYLLKSAFSKPNYDWGWGNVTPETNDLVSILAPGIVFALVLIKTLSHAKKGEKFTLRIFDGIFIGIGIILMAGSLYSPLTFKALVVVGKYFTIGAGFYFICRLALAKQTDYIQAAQRMIFTTWLIALALGLFALIQSWGMSYARMTIGSANPIPFSLLLAIGVVINFYYFLQPGRFLHRLIQAPTLLILLYALVQTNTRGTLIAASLGVLYLLFVYTKWHKGIKKIMLLIPLAALCIYVVNAYNPNQMQALTKNLELIVSDDQGSSIEGRESSYQDALDIANEYPLIGIGTGGFETRSNLAYPHNVLLELLSENGLIGLLALLTMFLVVVQMIIHVTRQHQSIGYALCAIVILNIFEMQVSFTFWNHKIFFMFAGLVAVMYYKSYNKIKSMVTDERTVTHSIRWN